MVSFLLDENISSAVAEQILRKEPGASILSIHRWHHGEFLSVDDAIILEAASQENLVLVTYDLSTIRPLLKAWGDEGRSHAGVIFIDDKSIAGNDYGALVKAILQAWERLKSIDFTDGVIFLQSAQKR